MTPQERQLIDDLFDRLSKLENAPRDSEAMSAIMQGLRNAPNAVYALVQTTLVQDEALKRANDRIQELQSGHAGDQNQPGGFLDSMRGAIFGENQAHGSATPGSVPNVRAPGMGGRPVWNSGEVAQQTQRPGQYDQGGYGQQPGYGQQYGAPQQPGPGGGGSSFLGTAAAAAATVAASKTGGRAAAITIWPAKPASMTSARREARAQGCSITITAATVHAPASSTAGRATAIMTTWTMIPTASTAMATTIRPEPFQV